MSSWITVLFFFKVLLYFDWSTIIVQEPEGRSIQEHSDSSDNFHRGGRAALGQTWQTPGSWAAFSSGSRHTASGLIYQSCSHACWATHLLKTREQSLESLRLPTLGFRSAVITASAPVTLITKRKRFTRDFFLPNTESSMYCLEIRRA